MVKIIEQIGEFVIMSNVGDNHAHFTVDRLTGNNHPKDGLPDTEEVFVGEDWLKLADNVPPWEDLGDSCRYAWAEGQCLKAARTYIQTRREHGKDEQCGLVPPVC